MCVVKDPSPGLASLAAPSDRERVLLLILWSLPLARSFLRRIERIQLAQGLGIARADIGIFRVVPHMERNFP
jgi:hypothetical protein